MFTYEYDHYTGKATTREDGFLVAELDINKDIFEQLDGEEMSEGVVEMLCDEMFKVAEKYKQFLNDVEHDETY